MNDTQKQTLLKTARETIRAVITRVPLMKPQSDDPELNASCGCFVTLKNKGQLRGCIGQFTSEVPLIQLVAEMAKASATGDPRFFADPITENELDELDIEISVLSSLKQGLASGCFLPQVATEAGWSREEFLSYCCAHKAGLQADAWKDPDTEVYLFTAEVFGSES